MLTTYVVINKCELLGNPLAQLSNAVVLVLPANLHHLDTKELEQLLERARAKFFGNKPPVTETENPPEPLPELELELSAAVIEGA